MTENGWVVEHHPVGAPRARLLCLPHAGGCAGIYRSWQDYAPPWLQVCAAELPGQCTRMSETPIRSMDTLVQRLGEAVMGLPSKLPLAIFGHSMGALVGFELARWLRRTHQQEPLRLVVAAFPAPGKWQALDVRISDLPDEPFTDFLINGLGAIPKAFLDDPEFLQSILPGARAAVAALEDYRYIPEPPLACPLSLIAASDDALSPPADVENWRPFAGPCAAIRVVRGGHFFLREHSAALVQGMGQEIAQDLRL